MGTYSNSLRYMAVELWMMIASIFLFSAGTIIRAIRSDDSSPLVLIMLIGNIAVTILYFALSGSLYYLTIISIPVACIISYMAFSFLFRRFDSKIHECHLSDLQFATGMAISVLILTIVADIVISYAFHLRVDAFRWPIIALPLWSASILVSISKIQTPAESSDEPGDHTTLKP